MTTALPKPKPPVFTQPPKPKPSASFPKPGASNFRKPATNNNFKKPSRGFKKKPRRQVKPKRPVSKFTHFGRVYGALEQYTMGAFPELMRPRNAVQGFSIPATEVYEILHDGQYLNNDGKPTAKFWQARILAASGDVRLWNMNNLLKVLRENAAGRTIRRIPVNQALPAGISKKTFMPLDEVADYFNLHLHDFKEMLVAGGWWFRYDYSHERGTVLNRNGKPLDWVVNRGFAKKEVVTDPKTGKETYRWVINAWHVMMTFSGQVGSPVPKRVIRPLDYVPPVPRPTVEKFAVDGRRVMLQAYRNKQFVDMISLAIYAQELGKEYLVALEKACGLPVGFTKQKKWTLALPQVGGIK